MNASRFLNLAAILSLDLESQYISRIFKASSGFMMAHFEAYLHAMTVGTSNNRAVNMKIMTGTL